MSKRKIYFRADAGAEIGYGHFIRTLALADMLKEDFECVFVTQAPTEYQKSEVAKVCPLIALPATDEKFGLFLDMLAGDEIVVLDNYFYDTDYQRQIKAKGCKLVCIDDTHDKHYVADVVINHGLTDPRLFDAENYTKFCLGLEWALLRKPFLQTEVCATRERGHWIIGFGGADIFNLTEKYMAMLQDCPDVLRVTAIVGDAYKYKDRLVRYNKVTVVRNQTAEQMTDLFGRAACAILSASTVTIEALACGCPVVAGYYVDNQKEFYEDMHRKGYITGVGDLITSDNIIYPENKWKLLRRKEIFGRIPERYIQLFKTL